MDLYVRLLGLPRIVLDGEPVHFPFRKLEALALTVFDQGDVTRDRLCSLLWGDKGDPGARKNLRNGLYVLRRLLPEEVVQMDRTRVWVSREAPLRLDRTLLGRFESLSDEQREVLGRPFLEEFDLEDAPVFRDWVQGRREEYRRDYLERVKRYAQTLLDRQDPAGATRWFERILALDPLDEEAVRQLMRLYHASGWAAGPLGVYEALSERLTREYQTGPAPETRDLYREILATGRSPETDFHGIAVPPERSVRRDGAPSQELPPSWRDREGLRCLESWERSPRPRLVLRGEEGSGKRFWADRLVRLLGLEKAPVARLVGRPGPGADPGEALTSLWPPREALFGGALEEGTLRPGALAARARARLEEQGVRVLVVERFDLLDPLSRDALLELEASSWDGGWIVTEGTGGPAFPRGTRIDLDPLDRGQIEGIGAAMKVSLSPEDSERLWTATGGNPLRVRQGLDLLRQGASLPGGGPFSWAPPLPRRKGRGFLERLALTPRGELLENLGAEARALGLAGLLRDGWLREHRDARGRCWVAVAREGDRLDLLASLGRPALILEHRAAWKGWARRARRNPLDGGLWERAAFHAREGEEPDGFLEARVRGLWARALLWSLPWPPLEDPTLRGGIPAVEGPGREEAEELLRRAEEHILGLGSTGRRRGWEPLLLGVRGFAVPGPEGREFLERGWALALRLEDGETAGCLALGAAERAWEEDEAPALRGILDRFFRSPAARCAPSATGHFLRLAGMQAEREGRRGAAEAYRRGAWGWFCRRERFGAGQTLGRLAAGLDLAEALARGGRAEEARSLAEELATLARERGVRRGADRLAALLEGTD